MDSDKSRVQLYFARGTFIVCFTYRGKSGHLRVTFMPNGKSEIVPRDVRFLLTVIVVYCLLPLRENK